MKCPEHEQLTQLRMNHSEHELLIKLIRARINQLEELLASATKTQEKLADQLGDEVSRIETVTQVEVDETLLVQAKREITQLRINLEWLNHKQTGECEACGRNIPVHRLMAVPATHLCVACAS